MAGESTPGSHQALRDAAGDLRKVIACRLGRQVRVVDRWMLPLPIDPQNRDANGIPNPLDHVIAIHQIVAADSPDRADALLDWLAQQCGGRFIRPAPGQRDLFPDLESAVKALGLLHASRGRKANPAKIAAARRLLQNFIDALAIEQLTP